MSERALAYQVQIGGRINQVYQVAGVKFDAFVNGVLRDGKGPGCASFVKNGRFVSWFRGQFSMLDQAERQLRAANGTVVEWHVAEEEAAIAIRNLFQEAGIQGIRVVVTPAK